MKPLLSMKAGLQQQTLLIVFVTGGAGLGYKVVHDYDYDGNETAYLVPKDRK